MSGIALIGAVLAVLILNIIPSTLPIELSGQLHLLYVLVSLFVGVITYQKLNK
jgi:ABC-type antimicrobial peptide transport system permease subunit